MATEHAQLLLLLHHPDSHPPRRFPADSPRRQFNILTAFFISAQFNYLTCFLHTGGSISNIPHAPPFAFLFTSILGFLQLKYQGKQETPFDTHPFLTSAGILSLVVYYCFGWKYKVERNRFWSNRCYRGMRVVAAFAGSVSLASTVSILFPDSITPISFVIFLAMAAAGELLLHSLCRRTNSRTPPPRQILPL